MQAMRLLMAAQCSAVMFSPSRELASMPSSSMICLMRGSRPGAGQSAVHLRRRTSLRALEQVVLRHRRQLSGRPRLRGLQPHGRQLECVMGGLVVNRRADRGAGVQQRQARLVPVAVTVVGPTVPVTVVASTVTVAVVVAHLRAVRIETSVPRTQQI